MAILIISNNDDLSTTDLATWLQYYDAKYHRINASILPNKDISLKIQNKRSNPINIYGVKDVNVIWHRRDELLYVKDIKHNNVHLEREAFEQLLNLNKIELSQFKIGVLQNIGNIDIIPNMDLNPNKLKLLKYASDCGLLIPSTIVTNNRRELIEFKKEHKYIITKSIFNLLHLKIKNNYYLNYTSDVSDELINKLPDYFFPSLFQENIEKKIELRIFYLEEYFYSMAMFSQKNSITSLDFRHYDDENPTRCVPFELPENIKEKLNFFMKKSNLKTGSIDMIYTENKEYVFLEVNPVGQYGMTSFPCNYILDKKIANHLINKDNEKFD